MTIDFSVLHQILFCHHDPALAGEVISSSKARSERLLRPDKSGLAMTVKQNNFQLKKEDL